MSANRSAGVEYWSEFLPYTHEQQSFLAFAFKYVFDTGSDKTRGVKVSRLVNDKFPDGEQFESGFALISYRACMKRSLSDWKQWQDLGKNDKKVKDAMQDYEVDKWLRAQRGQDWWKKLEDDDNADEALNLMLFARCLVFNSQTEENAKESFKKIAELVNELGPISNYTPDSAEKKFDNWQESIDHRKLNWSTLSSDSQEVLQFRQRYQLDQWVEKKGYKSALQL